MGKFSDGNKNNKIHRLTHGFSSRKYCLKPDILGLPHVLVPLNVDFVELPGDRRDQILLHLHGDVLR